VAFNQDPQYVAQHLFVADFGVAGSGAAEWNTHPTGDGDTAGCGGSMAFFCKPG